MYYREGWIFQFGSGHHHIVLAPMHSAPPGICFVNKSDRLPTSFQDALGFACFCGMHISHSRSSLIWTLCSVFIFSTSTHSKMPNSISAMFSQLPCWVVAEFDPGPPSIPLTRFGNDIVCSSPSSEALLPQGSRSQHF